MKHSVSVLLANLFMWVVVLAAAIVLLWDMDALWMMVIAILGAGAGSHLVVSNGLRHFHSSPTEPILRR
jgi:hypothetical protein